MRPSHIYYTVFDLGIPTLFKLFITFKGPEAYKEGNYLVKRHDVDVPNR